MDCSTCVSKGNALGADDRRTEGLLDGERDGMSLATADGSMLGDLVGGNDGFMEGFVDDTAVGVSLKALDGLLLRLF